MSELNEQKVYTVATAHLDTVWNWDLEYSIRFCIKNTLEDNFKLFEQFPDYKFSFEGSYRYELMEEYYPEQFKKMQSYAKEGRWFPCGSAYENGDVNIPSPEALFRNILYGNSYFEKKLGTRSCDIFLPDCFGFGWALPSIANHANLKGFTTQKLSWGSAYGTPFDFGIWQGVNGKSIYASIKPGSYTHCISCVRSYKKVKEKLAENEKHGINFTQLYHGVGDIGGGPKAKTIAILQDEINQNSGNSIKVLSERADQIYRDADSQLTDEQKSKLPVWNNELVMQTHAVGGYTSRVIGKRWNRMNEELAFLSESGCVTASYLGAARYPQSQLERSWKRFIGHQFHDDLPGTSVERAYRRSWNDLALSINSFSEIYRSSAYAVTSMLDTSFAKGQAAVVHNATEFDRTESVSATLDYNGKAYARAFDENNNEVPCQVTENDGKKITVLFSASVPALTYKTYDIRFCDTAPQSDGILKVDNQSLENEKYKVTLNDNGDIASVFDKELNKEILKKPIRFGIFDYNGSKTYPAWELCYNEQNREPAHYPVKQSVEIAENGNARVALRVVQKYDRSTFTYTVSLDNGGKVVRVDNELIWQSLRSLLKNEFSFTASNENALFDLGLGAIERGNMKKELYEVPAQKWVQLTDSSQSFGVSVISTCKYGWDKRDNNTLRMTVVHTPKRDFRRDSMQSLMDLGLNRYSYGIYSHGNETAAQTQKLARSITQPMSVFACDSHKGVLSPSYTFGEISDDSVILRAVKKAEDGDEIVVRFNEGCNKKATGVTFTLGDGIVSAREIFASEEAIGEATVADGKLVFDLEPYDVKSFALTLKPASVKGNPVKQQTVALPFNCDGISSNSNPGDGSVGDTGISLPAEILPPVIQNGDVSFTLGSFADGENNVLLCDGQTLTVPDGFNTLYLLAASLDGDKDCAVKLSGVEKVLNIASCDEYFAAWDLYDLNETAYVKNQRFAFAATHCHNKSGDIIGRQMFFYIYEIALQGASSIVLPDDKSVVVLSATAVQRDCSCECASALCDHAAKRDIDFKLTKKELIRQNFQKRHATTRMLVMDKDNNRRSSRD